MSSATTATEPAQGPTTLPTAPTRAVFPPVQLWDLPLSPITMPETLAAIEMLVEARVPSHFITANLNFAMLAHKRPEVRRVAGEAAFIMADGMPLVWAARLKKTPLPGRVAGSDLIFHLSELAAAKGYRMFFLGGEPGVAEAAAANLRAKYPGLQIVDTYAPPFRTPTAEERATLIARIREAKPDLLLVAFGQPKGELWIDEHLDILQVPLCAQVGATLDFAAGRVSRAPRVFQKTGLEWTYRLWLEPRRLTKRYLGNGFFFLNMMARHALRRPHPRHRMPPTA
jgi:N-acetylglucosaminyldiphosphoundecaprenol N-acetyl-beta-D-mannosaminyltransferase